MNLQEYAKENLDDINYFHTKAVVKLALEIAEKEGADKEIVETAGWLHDIGKMKQEHQGGSHHIASVEIAKELLKDKDPEFVEKVCDCIKEHMGPYSPGLIKLVESAGLTEADMPRPVSKESKVLYDADMINFMGPWGTIKVIYLEAKKGTSFTDAIIKRKALPQIIFDDLQTETGKEMGKPELEFIQKFMNQIEVQ